MTADQHHKVTTAFMDQESTREAAGMLMRSN
jgi:hypothetical protein